jgi:hypothetical protein
MKQVSIRENYIENIKHFDSISSCCDMIKTAIWDFLETNAASGFSAVLFCRNNPSTSPASNSPECKTESADK